jgi:regulator of PEP synthase PpsR (kinase-PPPase family)
MQRSVFFISDGTAITTETVGHSLLTQFPGVAWRQQRIPFVDDPEAAAEAVGRIEAAAQDDGAPPIVFISVIDDATRSVFYGCHCIILDLFADFLDTIERALGLSREGSVGRAHGLANSERYEDRMEATNYALSHDDGISRTYENADLILVGISRTGKTPTCLYMALHFGVKAANYPLTPEDLDNQRLPPSLRLHRGKIVGLIPTGSPRFVRRGVPAAATPP